MHRYVKEWLRPFRIDVKQWPPMFEVRSHCYAIGYRLRTMGLGCTLPICKAHDKATIASHCIMLSGHVSRTGNKSYYLLLASRILKAPSKPRAYFRK